MKKNILRILIISLFLTISIAKAQNSGIPLFRYYSYISTKHFYSTSSVAPSGYVSEGVLCYIFTQSVGPSSLPIFLVIKSSNGDRILTTSVTEKNNAISLYGYTDGGVIGYTRGYPYVAQTIYRYNNSSKTDHFYTNDYNELGAGKSNYAYEQTLSW